MQPVSGEPTIPREPPPRAPRVAIAVLIAALVMLGSLPVLTDIYSRAAREDLRNVVEPARTLVSSIHVSLALGASALRDYLSTHDIKFLRDYGYHTQQELAASQALAPLTRHLDQAVSPGMAEFQSAEKSWHDRVAEIVKGHPGPAMSRAILAEDTLYESAVTAAARLDVALVAAAGQRRQKVDRAERASRFVSLALATLAALAGVLALLLGRRLREYALASVEAHTELERVVASRERLARSITHDLKNPLNAILGNVQLLDENIVGPLTAAQHERLSRVESSANSMLELIDSLLELERAKSGRLQLEHKPVDLPALVQEGAENQRAAIEAAGLNLHVEVDPSIGTINTDPAAVTRVLENLLGNAAKFTESGNVRVTATTTRAGAPATGEWVQIAVQDSGPGIPTDRLETIFEEFSRLETSVAPGAGIGLAVCKRLASLLGGQLTVESELGKGSTFTLWLPTRNGTRVR